MSDWETLFVKASHRNGGVTRWRTEALAEDIKIPTVNLGERSSLWEICVFRWNKCGLIAFFDGINVMALRFSME